MPKQPHSGAREVPGAKQAPPICVECTHCRNRPGMYLLYTCVVPVRSIITGELQPANKRCVDMRIPGTATCGPEGKLYQSKP